MMPRSALPWTAITTIATMPVSSIMKLAKRIGMPCLCLDASCVNGTLDVHHAVPVRILRAEEWQ
eukprot:scaffold4428_cov57-Cyclotella_meneghiniana.AAC.4